MKENIYSYKRNITGEKMMSILPEINYRIVSQIINSDNRVIGILVNKESKDIYIPCLPSSIDLTVSFIPIDELNVYNEYNYMKNILDDIYTKSKEEIPCKPLAKLISNNMIVGIKTITNQIVPVIPLEKTEGIDDLEEENSYVNYDEQNNLLNDNEILLNNEIDEERQKIIKAIELENNFYKLFRNTLKIVINHSTKLEDKKMIINLINSVTITYIEKLERLIQILHKLLNNVVNFNTEFNLEILEDYDDMITCLGLNKSNCEKASYCTFMRQDTCELSLPKKNLYSKSNNKDIYFKRLADEIIRYSKIRKYIFTSREFLSFEHVNYKINDNEVILLEEILLDNYLEDIKLRKDNKYIKTTNIYDIVNPNKSIQYNTSFNKTLFTEENRLLR